MFKSRNETARLFVIGNKAAYDKGYSDSGFKIVADVNKCEECGETETNYR